VPPGLVPPGSVPSSFMRRSQAREPPAVLAAAGAV
jgi:hypothetical protein